MSKTLNKLLWTREWIAHIDDERSIGNSIIVTLKPEYYFVAEHNCGVRGFDNVQDTEIGTRKSAVYRLSVV